MCEEGRKEFPRYTCRIHFSNLLLGAYRVVAYAKGKQVSCFYPYAG